MRYKKRLYVCKLGGFVIFLTRFFRRCDARNTYKQDKPVYIVSFLPRNLLYSFVHYVYTYLADVSYWKSFTLEDIDNLQPAYRAQKKHYTPRYKDFFARNAHQKLDWIIWIFFNTAVTGKTTRKYGSMYTRRWKINVHRMRTRWI